MLENRDPLFYPPDLGNTGTTRPLQPFRPQPYRPWAEMPPAGALGSQAEICDGAFPVPCLHARWHSQTQDARVHTHTRVLCTPRALAFMHSHTQCRRVPLAQESEGDLSQECSRPQGPTCLPRLSFLG